MSTAVTPLRVRMIEASLPASENLHISSPQGGLPFAQLFAREDQTDRLRSAVPGERCSRQSGKYIRLAADYARR